MMSGGKAKGKTAARLGEDCCLPKEKISVQVEKSFGDFQCLGNIQFDVRENEFLCIVGPSGCGKTVLLEIIAGLMSPTKGKVTIDGEPIDPARHNISLVFQEPSCLPWRTLQDDVKFGLEIKGMDEKETHERIGKILEIVGLKGYEKYYPSQISGGMKQRVAIARAFVTHPDLLLMDEPFGHLDAQTRYFMQIEVLRIWEQMKRTVIFVTNNVEEAVFLGERVLAFSPTPSEIRAEIPINLPRPRSVTEQNFLSLRKEITDYYEVSI